MLEICGQQVVNTAQNLTASCGLKQLPTEFGQLTQLDTLDLSQNSLEQLPIVFFKLTQLTSLDLTKNRLDVLPTEFGQLARLTYLDLKCNNIDELPTEFGQLSAVTHLNLFANSMESLPTEFGQLTQLASLDLSRNALGPVELDKESDLYDEYNEPLPNGLFKLTRLTWLDFSYNAIYLLPTQFFKLTQLTWLDLSSTALGPVELDEESDLYDEHEGILEPLRNGFGQLTRLTWLNLSYNSLETLPNKFGKLTQLTWLDLKSNSLEVLPTEFGHLTQLTYLDLLGNRLVELPSEFGHLTQLTDLDLNKNRLVEIPSEFGHLTQLTDLDLNKNRLEELPTEFGQLAQLTTLDLYENSLVELPTEVGKLTQLTCLDLHENGLVILPTEFGNLTQLTELGLFKNRLVMLPTEFGQLTQLTELSLGSNSLVELPTEFGQLTQLTELSLGSNGLVELPTEFGHLTQLTELGLGDKSLELPSAPTNLTVLVLPWVELRLLWAPRTGPFQTVSYLAKVLMNTVSEQYSTTFETPHAQMNITLSHLKISSIIGVQVSANLTGKHVSTWSKPVNVRSCPAVIEADRTNEDEECYAMKGFYRDSFGLAKSCDVLQERLFSGAIEPCLVAGTVLEELPISKHFWRANLSSVDIRLCPTRNYCEPAKSDRSTASPDRYCAPYHSGMYCSDCVENYVLDANGCRLCTKDARESKRQIVVLVCTMLSLLCVLYVYVLYSARLFEPTTRCCRRSSRRQQKSAEMPRCKKLSRKVLIWTKVRILFGYFQVLSSYRRTFLKQTLTVSSDLLGVMTLISNVDVTWLVGNAAFRCFYDYNHYGLLLAATLGPIFLTVLLFACTTTTAYCMVRRLLKAVRDHTESAVLLLLFLIYPYVSQTVLGTFWCESFPDADRRFNLTTSALRADYRLSCEHDMDPARLGFEIYAGVMVLVYPVGVVALYSWVLYVHKDRVVAFEEGTEKLTKVSFLIKPYKVERFWFEAYELIRKLIQTSFVGFLTGLPVERELPAYLAAISLNLTVVFVVALLLLRPYKHRLDFAFALVSLLLLLPASLYSLLDPYARHEGISNSGLEALVITELCVFALFVVFELGRGVGVGCVKKASPCLDRCLKGEAGGGVQVLEGGDGDEPEVERRLVTTMKNRIVELEASRASLQAENERLRDEKVSLIQRPDDDSKETLIQPV